MVVRLLSLLVFVCCLNLVDLRLLGFEVDCGDLVGLIGLTIMTTCWVGLMWWGWLLVLGFDLMLFSCAY